MALPELPTSNVDREELVFTSGKPEKQPANRNWLHHWFSAGGENLLSYGQQGSYHWLRFRGLADFQISRDTREITSYPEPEIAPETIRHLLLDQVLPRCLTHQGKMMLHASAVRHEHGLFMLIGDSGAGKSTLAGDFHRSGNLALSDDCLWVKEHEDQVVAVPSYGGLRLWEDSLQVLFSARQETNVMAHYSTKKRVLLGGNPTFLPGCGIPVLAAFILSRPDEVSASEVIVQKLSRREAFIAMAKQSFRLNPLDLARVTTHLQALGRIAIKLPAYSLSIPHDYGLLPRVRQKILEAVL